MKTSEQAVLLAQLRRRDEQAAAVIGEAVSKLHDASAVAELQEMRQCHERHAAELDGLFGECGETARVPRLGDGHGLDRAIRAVHEAPDDRAVLSTVLQVERACHDAYDRADILHLPADEGPTVNAHLNDERQNVRRIASRLQE